MDDLTSFQFALRFDPEHLRLDGIEPLDGLPVSLENFGTFNLEDGEIRVVWAQEKGLLLGEAAPVFRLRFSALQSGLKLSQVLRIDESVLAGLSYNSSFAASGVALQYWESTGTSQADDASGILLQNRPNPFSKTTTITFVLPEACAEQVRVFDVKDHLLREHSGSFTAGQQTAEFDFEAEECTKQV